MRNPCIALRLLRLGLWVSIGVLTQAVGCSINANQLLGDWVSAMSTSVMSSYFNDQLGAQAGFSF